MAVKYKFTEEHKKNLSKALKGNKKLMGNQNWKFRDNDFMKQRIKEAMSKPEIRKKISINTKKAMANPIIRQKISLSRKGKKTYRKGLSMVKEYGEERAKILLKKCFHRRYGYPSSYEKRIISIINKHNLPYKFVGDGSFLIDSKNPDFINTNGEKIALEVFHNYYKIKNYGSIENYKKQRQEIFNNYGWRVIFLDEISMKQTDEEIYKQINHGEIKC